MSSVSEHRARAEGLGAVSVGVLTVSDTRDLATDRSGQLILDLVAEAGHNAAERRLVRDEPDQIRDAVLDLCAFKGRTCWGGCRHRAGGRTQDDFSVRAYVNQQAYAFILRQAGCQQARDEVRSYVCAEIGEAVHLGLRQDIQAYLLRRCLNHILYSGDKGF